ncbi:MAG: hypothetical protein M3Z17_05780 [Gemmatimonadota bacterium]|nr:hypothetical protein [Gemmatimonadota bacterium]
MRIPRSVIVAFALCIAFATRLRAQTESWPDGWRAETTQYCHAVAVPGGLPPVARLGDLAIIPSLLGWDETPPMNGFAVWSVGFDSSGALNRVAMVATDLGDSVSKRLTDQVANAIDAST